MNYNFEILQPQHIKKYVRELKLIEKNILYVEILLNRFYIKNILTVFIHHNLNHTIWH